MTVYILLAIMPACFAVLYRNRNTNHVKRKRYLILCSIVLIAVLGLRSRSVGSTDTNNYYRMMQRAINASTWGDFFSPFGVEMGFQAFVFCLSRVFKDSQWILLISSAVIVISNMYFIYHNSRNVAMSVTLFICLGLMTFEMQAMRQALAMSFCLLAYESVRKDEKINFICWITIALLFHRTAIIFAFIYFVRYMKYDSKHLLLLTAATIIFIALSGPLLNFANALFKENYDTAVSSGGFVAVSVYVLIILAAIAFDSSLKIDQDAAMIFYVLCVGFLFYIMRYIRVLAAERVSFYFMFSQYIVLPNSIKKMSKTNYILTTFGVYILAIGLFIYRMKTSDLVPFRFCFID